MATKVAELAVDITTNFAKVHADLGKLSQSVESAAATMSKAFSAAGGFIVGFAAAFLQVDAAVKVVRAGLDFGDKLQTMSDQTGIAVGKLQELSAVAVQNNTSIEGLGKAFKNLSTSIVAAQNAGGEQARLFSALGVATKDAAGNLRSVDAVMGDVADALNTVSDETVRTAAGVKIFGKGYLEVAASLRTFRESQDEANKMIAIFGTVTNESAKAADTFGDRIKLIGEGVKASSLTGLTSGLSAMNEALNAMAPIIAVVVKAFAEFIGWLLEKGAYAIINVSNLLQKLGATFSATAKFLSQPISFDIDTSAFTKLREEINALDKERQKALGKAEAAAHPERQAFDAASFRKFEESQRRVEDSSKRVAAALGPVATAAQKVKDIMTQLLEPVRKLTDDLEKQNGELTAQLQSLQQYGVAMEKSTEATVRFELEHGKLGESLDALTAIYPQLAEALRLRAIALARDNDALTISIRLQKEYLDAVKRHTEALAGSLQAIIDETAKEQQHAAEIGLTRDQIVSLTIAREQDYIAALRGIDGTDLEIRATELRIAALEKLRGAIANTEQNEALYKQQQDFQRGWIDAINSVTERFGDFFVDLVEHGSSAFKNLWEDFKRWALEAIAKIAAQQIVLSIVGNASPLSGIVGGLTGGGGGGIPGLGSLTDIFKIFGGGSGLGIGTALENLSTILPTFSTLLETGATVTEAASAAFAGMASSFATVVPVVGAIVGAGVLLYNYLESKKGGPKEAGGAGAGLLTGGPGDYFPQEYTDAGNKAAQGLADSIEKSFAEAMKRLGGKAAEAFGFDIGFDTDPQGTARSRAVGGVYQGGANIFKTRNENIGRTPEELSAALQAQAQQMLLAALQASDLPRYVAAIINSVDVATASSDQIAAILQTAEAIKGVVDQFPALQEQIANLDPEQIKSFIDALGGADQLAGTFAYLQKNFTESTDGVKEATDKLSADFTALGLAVPATHQGFLDLLSSFDLTTEAGRELYASVAALAPEFVAVAGSADDAAKKLQDATAFFKQNFYSDAERNAEAVASATRDLDAAQEKLGIVIPRTAEAFRALVESIDRATPAGEALYAALIAIAPAILTVSGGLKSLASAASAAAPAIKEVITALGDIEISPSGTPKIKSYIEKLRDLAKEAGGDLGEQLGFVINTIGAQIENTKKQMADALSRGDLWTYDALRNLLESLNNSNTQITGELAHYLTLAAQYDSSRAEQLISLEKWYADQQKLYRGDAVTLEALKKVFDKKWDDIIKGTGDGVDGTIGELERLRKSIADYLKSLQLSELSPLTPAQKLAEAQKQYQDALAKAAAGDPQALADITKFADAYLKQARDFYASSPIYADIFKQITEALALLAGTKPNGDPFDRTRPPPGPGPHGESWDAGQTALIAALPPIGNTLVSAEDNRKALDALGKVISDALAAVADANTQDSAAVVTELKSTAVKIVDGLGGNLK